MKFNLIVCTYKRKEALSKLLDSVKEQTLYPDEIIVVDASPDNKTSEYLNQNTFDHLKYFRVEEKDSGLTRQRNFGIRKTTKDIEICCFLDDDIVLEPDYFQNLLKTYEKFPQAVGVGGAIINEGAWTTAATGEKLLFQNYYSRGWKRKLGSRNILRKRLGLLSDQSPGIMPDFSNGFSIGFLPPTGEIYPVEYFMGGVASYKKELFQKLEFSPYFEGYGLYEDMDFCLRASKIGQLYVNTAARVYHYHEQSGRPDMFKYGKMVVQNGWYVWRVKNPSPGIKARIKWNATTLLLTLVRMGNVITTAKRSEALKESCGRMVGYFSLILKKPGRS